jgi:hypothetical protein
MTNLIGIDTLHLLLHNAVIRRGCQLNNEGLVIVPPSVSYPSGTEMHGYELFGDENGKPILGSKAFCNTSFWSLDIDPRYRTGRSTNCYLKFNLPKVASSSRNNLEVVDYDDTLKAIQSVEGDLCLNGIVTDLMKAKIIRMDLCRNIDANFPFPRYRQVLEILDMKRSKEKYQKDFDTTSMKGNSSNRLIAYDKVEEMRGRGIPVTEFADRNIFRFEWQNYGNSKRIMPHFGIVTVADLLNNYDDVPDSYCSFLQSLFRRDISQEAQVIILSETDVMEFFKQQFGRRWHQAYVNYVRYKDKDYFDVERDLEEAAAKGIIKRSMKCRELQLLKDAHFYKAIIEQEEGVPFIDLYHELQDKLVA